MYACVLHAQSCLTLCDPMDYTPPGSSVHGILQARTLEWVSISSSRGSSWPKDWTESPEVAGKFFTLSHRECRFNPWVEKILWRGNGNPLQYSCQDNPMDREAWRVTFPGVTKSQTQLSDWAHMHNSASSKEQPRQFREVMKSITYKEFPFWHKLQLWKTENWYYAPYE